ncbi:hypothetical protein STENM327S_00417 [Streptomyces tendae]
MRLWAEMWRVLLYCCAAVRGSFLPAFLNEYSVRPEQSDLVGAGGAPAVRGSFLEAAMVRAFVAWLAAAASEATPGTTTEPPTAARVRAEAVPARAIRDGTRLSADMRNPSSAACEG